MGFFAAGRFSFDDYHYEQARDRASFAVHQWAG
jgi:hypothetical protein